MPPELRNNIYECIALNTSMHAMRVVSGKNLVAAYEKSHAGHHTIKLVHTILTRVLKSVRPILIDVLDLVDVEFEEMLLEKRPVSDKRLIAAYKNLYNNEHKVKLVRTNLKWYLGLLPMPNIKLPGVDVTSILPSATARHPFSNTSRQLRAEFQQFDTKASGGKYLFILDNFDLKQMGLIAAAIHALDSEARSRDAPVTLHFHVCFTFDDNAVSSAKKMCAWIEDTNTVPLGLEYIAHKMTKIQVKNRLTKLQAERVYKMFHGLQVRRKESEVVLRPIKFVDFLFQNKVKVHWWRRLGTWQPAEVISWDAMARVTMR